MKLSEASWWHDPALRQVIAALGGEARIVGGAVRDSLLGLPVGDIDLATPFLPAEVIARLEAADIKAVPTGIEHGTVTAVADKTNFEITTLRRDVSTDGRRATVAFSTEWREDAARRDFTINALYADPDTGQIYDYFGGLADLEARRIRFIGTAAERIAEDHLRIMRFFRFFARFGSGPPDSEAINACAAAANSLKSLSRERIADELMKLLALPRPGESLCLMVEHGIFAAAIPEIDLSSLGKLARLIMREEAAMMSPLPGRRLNALLPLDKSVVETVAARLKLPNRVRTHMTARLAEIYPAAPKAKAIAYRHSPAIAIDMFLLHGGEDWQDGVTALRDWTVPKFPIKGGQLVQRGLIAGPDVAKTLQQIEAQWIAEDFPSLERVSAIADHAVAERLSAKNS